MHINLMQVKVMLLKVIHPKICTFLKSLSNNGLKGRQICWLNKLEKDILHCKICKIFTNIKNIYKHMFMCNTNIIRILIFFIYRIKNYLLLTLCAFIYISNFKHKMNMIRTLPTTTRALICNTKCIVSSLVNTRCITSLKPVNKIQIFKDKNFHSVIKIYLLILLSVYSNFKHKMKHMKHMSFTRTTLTCNIKCIIPSLVNTRRITIFNTVNKIQIFKDKIFCSVIKNKLIWFYKNNLFKIILLLFALHILTKTLWNNKKYYKKNNSLRFMHKIKDFHKFKSLPLKIEKVKSVYSVNYHIDLVHRLILLGKNLPNLTEEIMVNFLIKEFQEPPEMSLAKASINTLLFLMRYNPEKYKNLFTSIQILRGIGTENASSTTCELTTATHFPFNDVIISYIPQNHIQNLEKQLWTQQANPDYLINQIYYDVKNFNIGNANANTIIHMNVFIRNNELICQNFLNNFSLNSLLVTTESQFKFLNKNLQKFSLKEQQEIKEGYSLLLSAKNNFNLENYLNLQKKIIFGLQPMLWENYKITMHNLVICFNVIEDSRVIQNSTINHNFKEITFNKKEIKIINDFCITELEKRYGKENLLNKVYITKGSNLLLNLPDERITKGLKNPTYKDIKIINKYIDYWDTIKVAKSVAELAKKIENLP